MASGFLQTQTGAHVYYDYQIKGPELPVLVFLNGLSDETRSWQPLMNWLTLPFNILRVDLMGQGQALRRDLESQLNLQYIFTMEQQSEALAQVIEHLQLDQPLELIGFSYGGGVALEFSRQFPQKIQRLFLWLPYVIRLDQAHPMQRLWSRQFKFFKSLPGPTEVGFHVFENIYGNFLHQYMHRRYQNRIPDQNLREVAVQLSEGIMKFNAFEILDQLPQIPVHMISVERDTLIPTDLHREFWEKMPKPMKRSWLRIEDGEHLIVEQAPFFLARWLEYLLSHEILTESKVFHGRTQAMEVIDQKGISVEFERTF